MPFFIFSKLIENLNFKNKSVHIIFIYFLLTQNIYINYIVSIFCIYVWSVPLDFDDLDLEKLESIVQSRKLQQIKKSLT